MHTTHRKMLELARQQRLTPFGRESLQFYFDFNKGFGPPVDNSPFPQAVLTDNTSQSYVDAERGLAMVFDGVVDRLDLSGKASMELNPGDDFTVTLDMRILSYPASGFAVVVSKWVTSGHIFYITPISGGAEVRLYFTDGSNIVNYIMFNDGNTDWHRYTYGHNATGYFLKIDNDPLIQDSTPHLGLGAGSAWMLGAFAPTSSFNANIEVAEFALLKEALF